MNNDQKFAILELLKNPSWDDKSLKAESHISKKQDMLNEEQKSLKISESENVQK